MVAVDAASHKRFYVKYLPKIDTWKNQRYDAKTQRCNAAVTALLLVFTTL